jgi:hypothetical protein
MKESSLATDCKTDMLEAGVVFRVKFSGWRV